LHEHVDDALKHEREAIGDTREQPHSVDQRLREEPANDPQREAGHAEHEHGADRDDARREVRDRGNTEGSDHGAERDHAQDLQQSAEQDRKRGKRTTHGAQDERDEQHREGERANDEDPCQPRHRDRAPGDERGGDEHQRDRRGQRDTQQLVRDVRRDERGHDHGRAPQREEEGHQQERDGEGRGDEREPASRTLVKVVPWPQMRHTDEVEEHQTEHERADERRDRVRQGDLPEPIR